MRGEWTERRKKPHKHGSNHLGPDTTTTTGSRPRSKQAIAASARRRVPFLALARVPDLGHHSIVATRRADGPLARAWSTGGRPDDIISNKRAAPRVFPRARDPLLSRSSATRAVEDAVSVPHCRWQTHTRTHAHAHDNGCVDGEKCAHMSFRGGNGSRASAHSTRVETPRANNMSSRRCVRRTRDRELIVHTNRRYLRTPTATGGIRRERKKEN